MLASRRRFGIPQQFATNAVAAEALVHDEGGDAASLATKRQVEHEVEADQAADGFLPFGHDQRLPGTGVDAADASFRFGKIAGIPQQFDQAGDRRGVVQLGVAQPQATVMVLACGCDRCAQASVFRRRRWSCR